MRKNMKNYARIGTFSWFHFAQRVQLLFTNKTYNITHYGLVALFWPQIRGF